MTSIAGEDLAEFLRRLRREAGLSQELLAERAGLSVDCIAAYEQGLRHTPRRETIVALTKALPSGEKALLEFAEVARVKRRAVLAGKANSHNLPWQRTSFVGRRREIREISALLASRRIVTVVGAGGLGKTRTALEVASRLAAVPSDGVWFADLDTISDGEHVLGKLALVLDLRLAKRGKLLTALVDAIKGRELVLILDNCEHVIAAVREIAAAILDGCPRISLLATSRERLGIAGERAYQLSPHATPTAEVTTAVEAHSYEALELFADRAGTSGTSFQLSDEVAGTTADICRRLNGIALAIELAAARLPVLGLFELRKQLQEHFQMVSGGHGRPSRHRTLDATISWSHDLLDERERVLFRRLAVFSGGWTLEAADAVCADSALEKPAVLVALLSLAEKSLVAVDLDVVPPRYSFFEATRAFALEHLAASAEAPDISRRHAQWAAAFADRAFTAYEVTPRARWVIAVRPDLNNAIAALEWSLGSGGDVVLAARLASGLRGCWQLPGMNTSGQRYVRAALEQLDATENPALAGRLLFSQSRFLHGEENVNAMNRAIALFNGINDRRMLARCYNLLSYALSETGQHAEAENASDAALALMREEDLRRSVTYVSALCSRSAILYHQSRVDEAKTVLMEVPELAESLEDDWSLSWCKGLLADIEFSSGNALRAIELGEEAVASCRRIGSADQEICALANLACYQLALGEIDAAEASARDVLAPARDRVAKITHVALQHLATVAALRRKPPRAARLIGYVNAWYEGIGSRRDPSEQKGYEILMTSLHAQLSGDEIAVLAAQGAKLTETAAVDEALAE